MGVDVGVDVGATHASTANNTSTVRDSVMNLMRSIVLPMHGREGWDVEITGRFNYSPTRYV